MTLSNVPERYVTVVAYIVLYGYTSSLTENALNIFMAYYKVKSVAKRDY